MKWLIDLLIDDALAHAADWKAVVEWLYRIINIGKKMKHDFAIVISKSLQLFYFTCRQIPVRQVCNFKEVLVGRHENH